MRFRKRIKIVKGLNINLSGSGASLTVGGRGASVNVGKKGAYLNAGIPGSGLYSRQKIGGSKKIANSLQNSGKYNSIQAEIKVELTLDDKGQPILKLKDTAGREINDESIIRKIKRGEDYKKNVAKLMDDKKLEIENNLKLFIEICKSTPKLHEAAKVAKTLKTLEPKKYERQKFNDPKPNMDEVVKKLEYEALKNINKLLFWKNKKLRDSYIQEHKDSRLEYKIEKWNAEKKAFKQKQDKIETEENNKYLISYNNYKAELRNYLNGNEVFISSQIEKILNDITLHVDFSIDFEYDENHKKLHIDLDLPEIEDIPTKKVNKLASGKISVKDKTQKELKEEYATCVCGIAFYFAGLFFNISSNIEIVQISGYTQRINKKSGNLDDEYVYSIKFKRDIFKLLNPKNINPIEAFENFENNIIISKSFDLKTIIPF